MTTGSLGQGISAAAGVALSHKLSGRANRTFVIVGDGEPERRPMLGSDPICGAP